MDSDGAEGHNNSVLNRSLEHVRRRTRTGTKGIGGGILQVHGGGVIVRSTGRKDRHSKVYTAKGLRDRRVRLSAHTAIQFYDVQDRLGYDRPSKAVDWLIKKAKSAIDKLFELPSSNPNGCAAATVTDPSGNGIDIVAEQSESSAYNNFLLHGQLAENLIPPPLDSAVGFQSYQNLGLSLQTLQDTAVNLPTQNSPQNDQTVLYAAGSGNSTLGFDDSYEKMLAWNNVFGSQPVLNPSSAAFQQRVPLQSSLPSEVSHYAWNDLSGASVVKHHPIHEHSSPSSARFISDGLPLLDIQGRFQSDGDAGKASSHSSSYSRH